MTRLAVRAAVISGRRGSMNPRQPSSSPSAPGSRSTWPPSSTNGSATSQGRKSNDANPPARAAPISRSEEHTSELQSLMRISYAVFCLKKKKKQKQYTQHQTDIHNIQQHTYE